MTPEQVFPLVNLVALAGWILLAILPGRHWVSGLIAAAVIPGLLAVVYVIVLALHWSGDHEVRSLRRELGGARRPGARGSALGGAAVPVPHVHVRAGGLAALHRGARRAQQGSGGRVGQSP
jgi:hypothetical protein